MASVLNDLGGLERERKNYDAAANAYRSSWTEVGVGCEACHGPGAAHVGWARNGKPAAVAGKSSRTGAACRTGRTSTSLLQARDNPAMKRGVLLGGLVIVSATLVLILLLRPAEWRAYQEIQNGMSGIFLALPDLSMKRVSKKLWLFMKAYWKPMSCL